jgi:hypothetical protein
LLCDHELGVVDAGVRHFTARVRRDVEEAHGDAGCEDERTMYATNNTRFNCEADLPETFVESARIASLTRSRELRKANMGG